MCLQAYPKGLGIPLYLLQPDQMSSKRAKFQMYLHGQPIACLCARPSVKLQRNWKSRVVELLSGASERSLMEMTR